MKGSVLAGKMGSGHGALAILSKDLPLPNDKEFVTNRWRREEIRWHRREVEMRALALVAAG